jgi:hypothetical protein
VAIGNPDEIGDRDTRTACDASLAFLDAEGRIVARARKTVAAGQAAFLDFAASPPPDPESGASVSAVVSRSTLRALVRLQPPPDGDTPPPEPDAPAARCVITLEVFDAATGRTQIMLGGPDTVPALGGPDTRVATEP